LLTYSVERLRKEPELLDEEKKKIERSILSACTSNYTAFTDAARCLESIHVELSTVSKSLDLLLKDVPAMASACDDFSRKSSQLVDQFAANKQLANSQSSLMEVLEIPYLMETCVRNGVFDEALDLQSFVSRLSVLHPNVSVVQVLVKQTSDVGKTMLNALLAKLATNIQLPECLRCMGYLRRINAFSEPDLRLQFLSCREEWINRLVDDLEENDSYEFLKK
jgi:conserved oligomeric Golgi complex subunit 8